jgi:hypothetical protein
MDWRGCSALGHLVFTGVAALDQQGLETTAPGPFALLACLSYERYQNGSMRAGFNSLFLIPGEGWWLADGFR